MRSVEPSGVGRDGFRFLLVALLGVLVDLGIAYALHQILAVSLLLAGAAGFLAGALFNFSLHASWTFGANHRRSRLLDSGLRYSLATGIVFLIRLISIHILSLLLVGSSLEVAILPLATVASFVINFLLSRSIFKARL